jgi:hypothetical protein
VATESAATNARTEKAQHLGGGGGGFSEPVENEALEGFRVGALEHALPEVLRRQHLTREQHEFIV